MKKSILLAVLLCMLAITGFACNGAALDAPTSNPLPGSGTDGTYNYDDISANYALDILPEREIPESIPIEDPVWEPRFVCLTEEPTCLDEGCMFFELTSFDTETLEANFRATFFNPNADDLRHLTVFLILDDLARGIVPVTPDGYMKLDKFDIEAYPYFAFNAENNVESDTPELMYCYFQRDITFHLEEGSDFFVGFKLMPYIDQHVISVVGEDYLPAIDASGNKVIPSNGRTGGSIGDPNNPNNDPGVVEQEPPYNPESP
jgi:hypothetical protein